MNKSIVIFFVSSLLLFFITTSCDEMPSNTDVLVTDNNTKGATAPTEDVKGEPSKSFTEKDLTFEGRQIKLTHHARCRMDCRTIDVAEIQEIINKKQINQRKSKPNPPAGKCPSYAYEGRTGRDNQRLRIILGECEDAPIIITVIDLENEYQCNCK